MEEGKGCGEEVVGRVVVVEGERGWWSGGGREGAGA